MVALSFLKKKKKTDLPLPSLPNHLNRNTAKKIDLSHIPKMPLNINKTIERDEVPVFISVQDYEKIIHETKVIRAKLLESNEYLDHLEKIKSLHEKELEKLTRLLEKTENKISNADKIISK